MTPPMLNIDALDFQPWGHGVAISAADGKPRDLRFVGRAGESLEYWQGE